MQTFFLQTAEKGLQNHKIRGFILSIFPFLLTMASFFTMIYAMTYFLYIQAQHLFTFKIEISEETKYISLLTISLILFAIILIWYYKKSKQFEVKEIKIDIKYMKSILVSTFFVIATTAINILGFQVIPSLLNLTFFYIDISIGILALLSLIMTYINFGYTVQKSRISYLIKNEFFTERLAKLNKYGSFVAYSHEIDKAFIADIDMGIYEVVNKKTVLNIKEGEKVDVFIPKDIIEISNSLIEKLQQK